MVLGNIFWCTATILRRRNCNICRATQSTQLPGLTWSYDIFICLDGLSCNFMAHNRKFINDTYYDSHNLACNFVDMSRCLNELSFKCCVMLSCTPRRSTFRTFNPTFTRIVQPARQSLQPLRVVSPVRHAAELLRHMLRIFIVSYTS